MDFFEVLDSGNVELLHEHFSDYLYSSITDAQDAYELLMTDEGLPKVYLLETTTIKGLMEDYHDIMVRCINDDFHLNEITKAYIETKSFRNTVKSILESHRNNVYDEKPSGTTYCSLKESFLKLVPSDFELDDELKGYIKEDLDTLKYSPEELKMLFGNLCPVIEYIKSFYFECF